MSEFREYLALYLSVYYDSFEKYLKAEPNNPIDDCNSVAQMGVFACAFEIRHEGVFQFPESTQVFVSHIDRKQIERAADEAIYIGKFSEIEYVPSPANRVAKCVREAVK